MALEARSISRRGLNGASQQGPPRPHHRSRCCDARRERGLLWNVANEMDQEDGLIWVYGPGDDGVMAFTDFGIETLVELIESHKADPERLKRSSDPL